MQDKKAAEEPDSTLRNVRTCVDCGIESPEVETNYTLISARHGWRLTRSVDKNGELVLQWRCPRCWALFRSRQPT